MKTPSESVEAKALVRWMRRVCKKEGFIYSKIAQETPTTPEAAAKNTAEGVVRGVPDYLLVHVTSKSVFFVELKRGKGGKTSKHQDVWVAALGWHQCCVAHGWHEARHHITTWLETVDS